MIGERAITAALSCDAVIGSIGHDETLQPTHRPLTDAERRTIRTRVHRLAKRGRQAPRASLSISAAVVIVLWLVTLLASDAPRLVITLFWGVAGVVITGWVWRDMRRDAASLAGFAARLESALERNAADVYNIVSTTFVAFEEFEDEGASYAFELADGRIVFISGQEFYEGAKFPSLDFSIVHVLGGDDAVVDMFIEKRGAKVAPARTIPAARKHGLNIPDHLAVRRGRLDDLERWLG